MTGREQKKLSRDLWEGYRKFWKSCKPEHKLVFQKKQQPVETQLSCLKGNRENLAMHLVYASLSPDQEKN